MSANVENTLFEDYGNKPFVTELERACQCNKMFRRSLWTGDYLQMTLMSIPTGGQMGMQVLSKTDRMIFISSGFATVKMGGQDSSFDYVKNIRGGFCAFVPSGVRHNLINTGNVPLKLISVYAPPVHPYKTVNKNKKEHRV